MLVRSKTIYTKQGKQSGILQVEDGTIQAILPFDAEKTVDVDAEHLRIIPGIIDTHNHGTMGYGLMGLCDNEKIVRGYLKGLASQGVTSCLATADIGLYQTIVRICKGEIDGARPIGIHTEGPYLNRVGENGVDTPHPDIDMEHVKKMVEQGAGMLKLVAIAPEIPGAKEAIAYFTSHGVRCAFAHSNADYDQAMRSFDWGISVTTHTANVMSGIHHRHMGGLGACLLHDDVYNELIADGLHVSNEMIELMLRVKKDPFDHVMLVSDNIEIAGAPVGRYRIPDAFEVNVDEKGYCLTDTGRLFGSTMPVIKGIQNLVENLHIPMENVLKMSSKNPAKVYGANKGVLDVGKDADFVLIDDAFQVVKTFVEGKCVYDQEIDTDIFNPDYLASYAVH